METRSTAFLCLLFLAIPAAAQLSRRDMEDIARHRVESSSIPVLQSLGHDTILWDVSIQVGTWDFVDVEEDETAPVDINEGAGAVLEHFWESPDSLLAPMVADYIARHSKGLRVVLARYAAYEEELRSAFKKKGLPEDLTLLAAVESAMNPRALSKAGARGMWQLMPGTARHYGLRCDGFVDDRLDYRRSTVAAASYLEKAFARYGDWRLAISSYNCGFASVDRAITRAGSREYWDIYRFLPAETRGYFPAFAATLFAFRYNESLWIAP